MIYDIAIVGGGPAGLAAALNARRRNLQTVVIGKEEFSSKLTQAHRIDNYPGLPSITGEELARKLRTHAETNGMVFVRDEIQNIYPEEDLFNLYGREHHFQAKTIILATGITLGAEIEGRPILSVVASVIVPLATECSFGKNLWRWWGTSGKLRRKSGF